MVMASMQISVVVHHKRRIGRAGPRAIPLGMVVPAVGHAVMHMLSRKPAVFHTAEGYMSLRIDRAVPQAVPFFVVVPAVGYAVMHMLPRNLAVWHSAEGYMGLFVVRLPMMSAAVTVGKRRDHQRQRRHAGQYHCPNALARGFLHRR